MKIKPSRALFECMISGSYDCTKFITPQEDPVEIRDDDGELCGYEALKTKMTANKMKIESSLGKIKFKFYFDDICIATLGPIEFVVGGKFTLIGVDFTFELLQSSIPISYL